MDKLQKKTFTTSRALTYTYYRHIGDADKPTVVLQHGFPDSAELYADVVPLLLPTGHSLLIPDLLGYGGTSKPTETALYSSKAMAADLIEIIDAEKIGSVISLGHDWGSFMAQRLYLWHPDRVVGLVLLAVGYAPPSPETFDLQGALQLQEKSFGKPLYAYWELFTADDAPALVGSRLESFFCALHGEDGAMEQTFTHKGALRKFLEEDRRVPLLPFARDEKLKNAFIARLDRDGLAAPFQWYRAMASNVLSQVEKEIPAETLVIRKPVLFVAAKKDPVCLPVFNQLAADKGLLPNLTVREVDTGHWCTLEDGAGVGKIVAEFLQSTSFC